MHDEYNFKFADQHEYGTKVFDSLGWWRLAARIATLVAVVVIVVKVVAP